ncbi:hypothetical protein AEGHOMDF_0434 [Methylobacterium soli]|nr:hypothetical protein AEGHOMDF_0434 [Methylobacterium soli]
MREIARTFGAMLTADHLLTVVDAFRSVRGVSDSRVSTLLFNDGKRIRLLREGGDIGSRFLAAAFQWLSDRHWKAAAWPEGIARPEPSTEQRLDEPAAGSEAAFSDEVQPSVACRKPHGLKTSATEGQSR